MSRRELPDFLKTGDPALTYPHGVEVTPNHPRGRAIIPRQRTDSDVAREWLEHVAAGRIGQPRPSGAA